MSKKISAREIAEELSKKLDVIIDKNYGEYLWTKYEGTEDEMMGLCGGSQQEVEDAFTSILGNYIEEDM